MKNIGKFPLFILGLLLGFGISYFAKGNIGNTKIKPSSSMNITPTLPSKTLEASILEGLKSGNATLMAPHFDEEVSFITEDEDDFYSPAEAKESLSYFFNNDPVTNFSLKHSGMSQSGKNQYWIGDMTTTSGQSLRAYISSQNGKIVSIELTEK